jgi:hypothetical protein
MQINNHGDLQKHFLILYFQNGEKNTNVEVTSTCCQHHPSSLNVDSVLLAKFTDSAPRSMMGKNAPEQHSLYWSLFPAGCTFNQHQTRFHENRFLFSVYVIFIHTCFHFCFFVNWNKQLKALYSYSFRTVTLSNFLLISVFKYKRPKEVAKCPGI